MHKFKTSNKGQEYFFGDCLMFYLFRILIIDLDNDLNKK